MRTRRQFFSGVPFSLAVAALSALATSAPAQTSDTTWRDAASRWRTKALAEASDLQSSVRAFCDKHLGDQPPMARMRGLYQYDRVSLDLPHDPGQGPGWTALAEGQTTPDRVVLLVHGLDEIGDLWDDLVVPLSHDARFDADGIIRFEYPNDQAIATSAAELDAALQDLHLRGTRRVDLVCHSMGGLLARDVLTRAGLYEGRAKGHADRPDLASIVMLGTPNEGSPLAKLRSLAQVREQVERWIDSDNHNVRDLFRLSEDGDGKAGDDLMPDSPYLADLNSRALPPASEIPITAIIGRVATPEDLRLDRALSTDVAVRVLGPQRAAALLDACRRFACQLGDGVVSCTSASLGGAKRGVAVDATHRSMLRRLDLERIARNVVGAGPAKEPPAIPIIMSCLAESRGL